MAVIINSSIKRSKLYKNNYDADTTKITDEVSKNNGFKEDFYEPLVKIFELMYINGVCATFNK